MATVLHRTTRELRRSVNTPDFDTADWIINPTLPECEPRYWKITGDTVSEMDAAEKEAVDLPLAKAAKLAAIDAWWEQQGGEGIDVGGGVMLASRTLDATQYATLLGTVQGFPDGQTIVLADATGNPVSVTVAEFKTLAPTYTAEWFNRRGQWAAAKAAVAAATTTAEVAAVEVPGG